MRRTDGFETNVCEGTTDEQPLVAAAQAGDHTAFAALVRRHQRRAYAVCRAILIEHHDAEDAVQDGFLNAYRRLDRFRLGQPFGAWLHAIMVNASLDLRRRRRVRETDALPPHVAAPSFDPGERHELRAALAHALGSLGERQRIVTVLHEVEGFTHAEIGAMLGIPEGTAKYDLFAARRTLRSRLQHMRP